MTVLRTSTLLAAGLLLTVAGGCTDLTTISGSADDPDSELGAALESAKKPGITVPDAGLDTGPVIDTGVDGEDVPGNDSDELCLVPNFIPRFPAVSAGEGSCEMGAKTWPDCLPQLCDGLADGPGPGLLPDFETACQQHCEMTCERERWFCDEHHCQAGADGSFCESEAARAECVELCGMGPGAIPCLLDSCTAVREVECVDMNCKDRGGNVCGGLDCNNDCTGKDGDPSFVLDGVCDDGSPVNADTASCDEGSDCADCGARAECFPEGNECFSSVQCCGFDTEVSTCINVGTDEEPLGRCVPDCTGADEECPEGFECIELQGGGKACFPFCSLTL